MRQIQIARRLIPALVTAASLVITSCFLLPMSPQKYESLTKPPPTFLYDDFEQNDGTNSTRYYYECENKAELMGDSAITGNWSFFIPSGGSLSFTVTYPSSGSLSFKWKKMPEWPPFFMYIDGSGTGITESYQPSGEDFACGIFRWIEPGTHVVTLKVEAGWGGCLLDDLGTYEAFPMVGGGIYDYKAPSGITRDSTGRLVVVDTQHYRIVRTDGLGAYNSAHLRHLGKRNRAIPLSPWGSVGHKQPHLHY